MKLSRVIYPVNTLGGKNRMGIWFQGCNRKCPNCISPENQCYDKGFSCSAENIFDNIPDEAQIMGLTISGGEPFCQEKELRNLVELYNRRYSNDIIIFTGYTFAELERDQKIDMNWYKKRISVLIDGPYIDELNDGKGLRGSSNQNILIFQNQDKYVGADKWRRELQSVNLGNKLIFIGIPPRENAL